MRRPLNWFVVCISLVFLLANLLIQERGPQVADGQLARPAMAEVALPSVFARNTPDLKFGYVRADGSFQPLSQQTYSQSMADAGAAVFVWNSPWLTTRKEPKAF